MSATLLLAQLLNGLQYGVLLFLLAAATGLTLFLAASTSSSTPTVLPSRRVSQPLRIDATALLHPTTCHSHVFW